MQHESGEDASDKHRLFVSPRRKLSGTHDKSLTPIPNRTKEVGWEADDESDAPKSPLGIKRYRWILDFSRRSAKAKVGRKTAVRHESKKRRDGSRPDSHRCYGCGKTRCADYHDQYPLKSGKEPVPSLCTECRCDRKTRLAYRSNTRDGGRHRCRATKRQARIDECQWCANCGRLRSDDYHDLYYSGDSLPPWAEVCGRCVTIVEKKTERERRRLYFEKLDMEAQRMSQDTDPLRDTIRRRRSSPYALKLACPVVETTLISASTATSSPLAEARSSKDLCDAKQLPVVTRIFERSSNFPRHSEREHTQSSTHTVAFKDDGLGEDSKAVVDKKQQAAEPQQQTPQNVSTPRPQQQEKRREPSKMESQSSQAARPVSVPTTTVNDSKERQRRRHQHPSQRSSQFRPSSSLSTESHDFPPPPPRPQQARPMGVSDMYWASEEGRAEQCFTAAGHFFPAGAYGFSAAPASGGNAYPPTPTESAHDVMGCDEQNCQGSPTVRDTTTNRAVKPTSGRPTAHKSAGACKLQQQQVWEIDSDEAEEIERSRAKLFNDCGAFARTA